MQDLKRRRMKGIILAGGSGTRLYPITKAVSKQLLPIYDKPMIYYPLSVLMLAGIRDILLISTPLDLSGFKALLKNGKQLGLNISYKAQPSPDGLAQALILGEEFLQDDDVCLILGDNIHYGQGLVNLLKNALNTTTKDQKAVIFGYYVKDPNRYGVVEFDAQKKAINIEEKPKNPKSNYAVTGLYFYPKGVSKLAKTLKPSSRGELEITDLNKLYLDKNELLVEIMGRGYAWLDTGTHDSLLEAGSFVKIVEERQGLKIACVEEIAYELGYISKNELLHLAKDLQKSSYGEYLLKRIEQ